MPEAAVLKLLTVVALGVLCAALADRAASRDGTAGRETARAGIRAIAGLAERVRAAARIGPGAAGVLGRRPAAARGAVDLPRGAGRACHSGSDGRRSRVRYIEGDAACPGGIRVCSRARIRPCRRTTNRAATRTALQHPARGRRRIRTHSVGRRVLIAALRHRAAGRHVARSGEAARPGVGAVVSAAGRG